MVLHRVRLPCMHRALSSAHPGAPQPSHVAVQAAVASQRAKAPYMWCLPQLPSQQASQQASLCTARIHPRFFCLRHTAAGTRVECRTAAVNRMERQQVARVQHGAPQPHLEWRVRRRHTCGVRLRVCVCVFFLCIGRCTMSVNLSKEKKKAQWDKDVECFFSSSPFLRRRCVVNAAAVKSQSSKY